MSINVSVIIPTYNACERLYLTLCGFQKQTYPHNLFEVIIADDGSTDNTMEMISKYIAGFTVKIIKLERNYGRAYNRNRAILAAEGKIIIFNDCDMIPSKKFIRTHVDGHSHNNMVVLGSIWNRILTFYYTDKDFINRNKKKLNTILNKELPKDINMLYMKRGTKQLISRKDIYANKFSEHSFIPSWSNWYQCFMDQFGNDFSHFNFPWIILGSGNMSVYKDNIINVGLFDEEFKGWGGEDWEFGYRLKKYGLEFSFNPMIISYHQEHPYSKDERNTSSVSNQLYILKKHKSYEIAVFQFAAHLGYGLINSSVNEYYELKEDKNNNEIMEYFDIIIGKYQDYYCDIKLGNISENIEIPTVVIDNLSLVKEKLASHFCISIVFNYFINCLREENILNG